MNFVLSCLQEEKVANPSGMEEMLKDLLGNGKKLEPSFFGHRASCEGQSTVLIFLFDLNILNKIM